MIKSDCSSHNVILTDHDDHISIKHLILNLLGAVVGKREGEGILTHACCFPSFHITFMILRG